MRAPFQILAIPYRIVDGTPMYCVFHRADHDQWQFIAGGGEDNETPLAAAKRETFEEGGVHSTQWLGLKSLSYIPVTIISEMRRKHYILLALNVKMMYGYLLNIPTAYG